MFNYKIAFKRTVYQNVLFIVVSNKCDLSGNVPVSSASRTLRSSDHLDPEGAAREMERSARILQEVEDAKVATYLEIWQKANSCEL